jgi:alpha-mannosidase
VGLRVRAPRLARCGILLYTLVPMITVHMIGNAHLDPVWLWRWPAGVAEALATCRTACDLLDDEPDVVFTRSDAWLYERVEALDAGLFDRIRAHVAAGRWAVVGGWYVQPDCNLPLAASFAKHMELGLRHAREKLGVDVTVGYNVDSFGHTAALPRLLRAAGYDSYVFMRPMAHEMALPAALFRWRTPGDSGPGVIAWRLPLTYCPAADDLSGEVRAALAAAVPGVDHVMCFYGVGDHGGGPTRRQTAWIRSHRDSFEGARLAFSHPRAFFDAVTPQAAALPEVTGEMQMHAVGCYSVVRGIKVGMRRAEHALLAAEAAAAAFPAHAPQDASVRLAGAWRLALFNQFHDICGGTSLADACDDARDQLGAARSAAEGVLYDTLFRRAADLPADRSQRVVAFNPSDAPFDGWIRWEPWFNWRGFEGWIADAGGRPVPHQVLPGDPVVRDAFSLLWPARIAPRGLAVFTLRSGTSGEPAAPPAPDSAARLTVSQTAVANGCWTAAVGTDERLLRFAGSLLESLRVEVREDPSDTWSHGIDRYAGAVAGCFHPTGSVVEEAGPLRASLRVEAAFGRSTLGISARLYAGDPRLELEMRVDWRERHRVAKLALRFAGPLARRTDGIQDMGLERPQDGREYPLVDWTVARVENGGIVGVACPDCFALSGESREVALTLLRSPVFAWHDPAVPDRDRPHLCTDQGEHRFRFVVRAEAVGDAGGTQTGGARTGGAEAVGARCGADALAFHRPPACFDWTKGMPP